VLMFFLFQLFPILSASYVRVLVLLRLTHCVTADWILQFHMQHTDVPLNSQ
jgi:hypothetical protein